MVQDHEFTLIGAVLVLLKVYSCSILQLCLTVPILELYLLLSAPEANGDIGLS